MAASESDILRRADATFAVMGSLQNKWVWGEMDVPTFAALLGTARTARTTETDRQAIFDQTKAHADGLFKELERLKVQGIGIGKYAFRKNSEHLAQIEGVGEYGDGREDTLKEAEEWAAAWKLIDPTWNPAPGNTYVIFTALIASCRNQMVPLAKSRSQARKAAVHLNTLLAELEDLCIAWYGTATRTFKEGSEEGDLIRGQIPTFDDGGAQQPAVTPTPAP